MAKKLVSVWLSLTILLFSSISIYAEENIQGDFFTRDIVINGEKIANNQLQYPFFMYQDTVYMPLTSEMAEVVGLETEMDWESRTLKLLKKEPTRDNISERSFKNKEEDILVQSLSGGTILAYELAAEPATVEEESESEGKEVSESAASKEIIQIPELTVREIQLGDFSILMKRDILYLPVRAFVGEEGLGWDTYYDSYTGVYISTVPEKTAKSYWREAESKYNKGLVNYIKKYNKGYSTGSAQELVFLFKKAAEEYNIDEKILMAVAHRESTFNAGARGGSGSLGMMQVMPATGAGYGLSKEQLLDAKTSIDFGAMYLSQKMQAYNGDLVKGFSAYNQGPGAVNRGTYNTRYATKIITTVNNIESHLTSNGYGTGK